METHDRAFAIQTARTEYDEKIARIRKQFETGKEKRFLDTITNARNVAQEAAKESGERYSLWLNETFFGDIPPPVKVMDGFRAEKLVSYLDHIGMDLRGAQLGYKQTPDLVCGLDARMGDWTGSDFENANLRGFNVNTNLRFEWCNFKGADLSNIPPGKLPEDMACLGRMECSTFDHGDFTDANLSRQTIISSSFRHCNFTRANFSDAASISGDFTGAIFKGTVFKGARIDAHAFHDAVADEMTDLTDVTFESGMLQDTSPSFQERWKACNPELARTKRRSGKRTR